MILKKHLLQIKPYIAGKLKEGAIKLASNENPLGPSPLAIKRVKRFLKKIYLYPDSQCEALKLRLAKKCGITPDMLVIGNGSDEILLFIAGAYTENGTNSVTSETTFSEYTFATMLFGGTMKFAGMSDFKFDLDAIRGLVDSNTRVVYLANPNNPTGTYFNHSELARFLKNMPKEVLVVLDEAYSEFAEAADYPKSIELLNEFENLLILRTFSKMYGLAGLRVGYGIGSKKVIDDLLRTKEPFNVNSIAQVAALAALDDEKHVARTRAVNKEGKHYLYKELDALKIRYCKTEANFIYMNTGIDADKVFKVIMDRGVTIRPMAGDAIRVTVGTKKQNELFIKLLRQVLIEENNNKA
jgi:histidinol-phosphate aminotransferase